MKTASMPRGKQHSNAPKRRGWWFALVGLLVVPAIGGGAAWWWMQADDETPKTPPPTTEALIAQMRAATQGWVDGPNVFGGSLKTGDVGGRRSVTVTNIPNKPCVQATWVLAREGQVTVNGLFLPRLSAGKLAELCSSTDNNSTLLWILQ